MTDFSVDTNILIYSVDPTDALKHAIAVKVVGELYTRGATLPLQCLSEFYGACSRKAHLRTLAGIDQVIDDAVQTLDVMPYSVQDLLDAKDISKQEGFQFFDCLILATARRTGCSVLFSEDFQHGRSIAGLTVLNPFRLSEAELDALLAV